MSERIKQSLIKFRNNIIPEGKSFIDLVSEDLGVAVDDSEFVKDYYNTLEEIVMPQANEKFQQFLSGLNKADKRQMN